MVDPTGVENQAAKDSSLGTEIPDGKLASAARTACRKPLPGGKQSRRGEQGHEALQQPCCSWIGGHLTLP